MWSWILVALAVTFCGTVSADDGSVVISTDAQVEALVQRARQLAREKRWARAAEVLVRIEDRAAEREAEDPTVRLVVQVDAPVAYGVYRVIADLLAAGPQELQAAYHVLRAPHLAKLRAEGAEATQLEAWLTLARRFPGASGAGEAWLRSGDLLAERGELASALEAYGQAERAGSPEAKARREALRGMPRAASALWPTLDGNGARAGVLDQRVVGRFVSGRSTFTWTDAMEHLATGYGRRAFELPKVYRPVVDANQLYVCDGQRLLVVRLKDGSLNWVYEAAAPDPQGREQPPERLDNLLTAPALAHGLVAATLNGNAAASTPSADGAEVPLPLNWRVVALDASTGALRWDSAQAPAFAQVSREALFVSAPLIYEGRVFVSVALPVGNGVHIFVVALRLSDGEVAYQRFLCAATSVNTRTVGVQPAPPAAAGGQVFVQSNAGVVAAVHAVSGELRWVHRYAPTPRAGQRYAVLHRQRFSPCAPSVVRGRVVVLPQDSSYAQIYSAETGGLIGTLARAGLSERIGTDGTRVFLAGDRQVVAWDVAESKVAWRAELDAQVRGRGFATKTRVVIPVDYGLVVLATDSGERVERLWSSAPATEVYGNVVATRTGLAIAGPRSVQFFTETLPADVSPGARLVRHDGFRAELVRLGRHVAIAGAPEVQEDLRERALALCQAHFQRTGDVGLLTDHLELLAASKSTLALVVKAIDHCVAEKAYASVIPLAEFALAHLGAFDVVMASGLPARAPFWIRGVLAQLRGDAQLFVDYDTRAQEALARARIAGTPEALEAVGARWPTAPAEADAFAALADSYEQRGLPNQAITYLRSLEVAAPESFGARNTRRMMELLHATQRFEEEAQLVERLLGDEAHLPPELKGFALARRAELVRLTAQPSLPGGVGRSEQIGMSFHTQTELDGDGAELVGVRGLQPSSAVFIVRGPDWLGVRELQTGRLLWRLSVDAELDEADLGVANAKLVVRRPDALLGLDLLTGARSWRLSVQELLRGREPEPSSTGQVVTATAEQVRGFVVVGGHGIAVVHAGEGSGSLVLGIDLSSGKPAWLTAVAHRLAKGLQVVDGGEAGALVVGYVENPARLIAVAAESGELHYDVALGEHDPRLTLSPRLGARGTLYAIVGGNVLVAVDGATGRVSWQRRLPYWPRDVVASSFDEVVAVVPFGSGKEPRFVVLGGRSSRVLVQDVDNEARVRDLAFVPQGVVVYSGDYIKGTVKAFDLKSGRETWSWECQRGHSFESLLMTRGHVVLPQTSPSGPNSIYALDRRSGKLFHTFDVGSRRIISAVVQGGSLLVSTNRGVLGFAVRDDDAHWRALVALDRDLKDSPLAWRQRSQAANHLCRLGQWPEATACLIAGLELEGYGVQAYTALQEQLVGVREMESSVPAVSIGRLPRAPAIDGELDDWWRLEQSFALFGQRYVAPIQGREGASIFRGYDDVSATVYLGYDAQFLYFALDVNDSRLVPYDSESDQWRGDCLLMALDPLGNGGDYFARDDNLLSLALTLPKRNKDPGEDEDKDDDPEGKYFVKRKDDGSGAVYEVAIPWASFAKQGADVDTAVGPKPGFRFGLNLLVTDDDDAQGARQVLSWTPAMTLHRVKSKMWQGFVPSRFVPVICR